MAKFSTKLISIVLAVVMLVSMVPMVAFAEGELPALQALTPDASMDVRSASISGNVYSYKVGYWNDSFMFTMTYAEGVTAVVKTNIGAEITADEGVYTVPLRQYSIYTYYIELTNDAGTSTYQLKLQRLYNDEAEILDITGDGFTADYDAGEFYIYGDEEGRAVQFGLELSLGSAVVVKNEMGQLIAPKNGIYTVAKNDYLIATVTAHDGKTTNIFYISVVVSRGNDNVELYGIDDAVWNEQEGAYVANTTYNTFLVNATVPAGATYSLYADEDCYDYINNRNLKLKEAKTTVYLVVEASDGYTVSDPHKLVINTTADPADDDAEAPLPMGGCDELYLRGGFGVTTVDGGPAVMVFLPEGTEEYKLEAQALGYDMTIFADPNMEAVVLNNTTIKLDSGVTLLYAYLTNAREEELIVPIMIISPAYNEYTDTQVAWAEDAINGLAESGLSLLKGDAAGKFNGTAKLTRNELAAVLCRMNFMNGGLFKNVETPFADEIASWAAPYAAAAYSTGLMNGTEVNGKQYFNGSKTATRNEVFRVITNYVLGSMGEGDVDAFYAENKEVIDNVVKNMGFKDADKVADWAKPGTYTAIYLGLVQGNDAGYINPTAEITRNEVAILLADIFVAGDIIE